jgi:hypothetical protein
MSLERRQFLKFAITGGAVVAASPSVLLMEGCSFSVVGMVNVVLSAVQKIAAAADPSASWLPALNSAIVALEQAEANWQNTGIVSVLEDALNTIVAVMAAIPFTEPYAALVGIVVAGVEAVINYFAPSASAKARFAQNPYSNRVPLRKPHAFQSYQGAFRSQWNDTAKGLGLTSMEI